MNVLRKYSILYFSIVACFFLAALLAAAGAERAVSAGGEGSGVRICLDPGHGGEDGGAVSVTGVQESAINLQLALRLRDLMTFCGQRVFMTREGDYALYGDDCATIAQKKASDLRSRAALVSDCPGAILLSIHQNHYSDGRYRGAQVFFNGAAGSEDLARSIQDALRIALDPDNHREIKKADGVYLLSHIDNTAVLVECGFLSNGAEEILLRDSEYQKKISCAISAGLLNYLNNLTVI